MDKEKLILIKMLYITETVLPERGKLTQSALQLLGVVVLLVNMMLSFLETERLLNYHIQHLIEVYLHKEP